MTPLTTALNEAGEALKATGEPVDDGSVMSASERLAWHHDRIARMRREPDPLSECIDAIRKGYERGGQ